MLAYLLAAPRWRSEDATIIVILRKVTDMFAALFKQYLVPAKYIKYLFAT